MKDTMNSRNIAKYHKMLAADVKPSEISKALKVSPETLKRFAPKKAKVETKPQAAVSK